jgi:hypothetical protein
MATKRLELTLLVYREDGGRCDPDSLKALAPEKGSRLRYNEESGSAAIELAEVSAAQYPETDAGADAFEEAQREVFLRAGKWLEHRPSAAFAGLRAAGLVTEMWLFVALLGDQFELNAAPAFLRACGERELPFRVIAND